MLHVLDRETREPITVHTRRPCAPWSTDEAAIEMLFDLLAIALRHETHEASQDRRQARARPARRRAACHSRGSRRPTSRDRRTIAAPNFA